MRTAASEFDSPTRVRNISLTPSGYSRPHEEARVRYATLGFAVSPRLGLNAKIHVTFTALLSGIFENLS
jgi:hypothetical protein